MKHDLRLMEAILFAASEPVDEAALAERFAEDTDVAALIDALAADYAPRGVNLVRVGGGWASDLRDRRAMRWSAKGPAASRAAVETLASRLPPAGDPQRGRHIRRVAASRGTFDFPDRAPGWIRPVAKRRTPAADVLGNDGRFLVHFGCRLTDLPATTSSSDRAAGCPPGEHRHRRRAGARRRG